MHALDHYYYYYYNHHHHHHNYHNGTGYIYGSRPWLASNQMLVYIYCYYYGTVFGICRIILSVTNDRSHRVAIYIYIYDDVYIWWLVVGAWLLTAASAVPSRRVPRHSDIPS